MNEESDYTWFLDVRGNGKANEMIAEALAENSYESECHDMLVEGNKRLPLWECPDHAFLSRFEERAKSMRLPYDIYLRKGKYGLVRLWQFGRPTDMGAIKRRHHMPIARVEREARDLMGV